MAKNKVTETANLETGAEITAGALAANGAADVPVADDFEVPATPHTLDGASAFNLDEFLVDEDVEASGGAATTVAIAVGKPHKQTFFRAHPDFRMKSQVLIYEEGMDRKTYLLSRAIAQTLPAGEYAFRELRLLVSNFGELMLYPVGVPGDSGGGSKWTESAREAVEIAEQNWVRMPADKGNGRYAPRLAEDQALMGEPIWPADMDRTKILLRAFGEDAIISQSDHPVLLKLRGRKV